MLRYSWILGLLGVRNPGFMVPLNLRNPGFTVPLDLRTLRILLAPLVLRGVPPTPPPSGGGGGGGAILRGAGDVVESEGLFFRCLLRVV